MINNLLEDISKALEKDRKFSRNSCMQYCPKNEEKFHLFEGSDGRTYVVESENEVQIGADYIVVYAESNQTIGFISIDKCLIKDSDSPTTKKCDAALTWDAVLALVELKLNTENLTPGAGTANNFHLQMKSTINYFQTRLSIPLDIYAIRIYVVFPVATITTTMGAELFGFENDIFNTFGLNAEYFLIPDSQSGNFVPELRL